MGAYLSEPVTEKYSSDEVNEYMEVGASSMQGWRISQEDAHNCILKFDENTSFFAVYDGHGGAEVATYCSEKLPEFLKGLKSYKEKDFEQALKDAFLGFDGTLLEEDIIEILKKLAGEKNPDRDSELAEEEEEEDLAELCQEGSLPLDQVLEKYKGSAVKFPQLNKIKEDEPRASGSGTSKPLSPFLRARKNACRGSGDLKEPSVDGSMSISSSVSPDEEKALAETDCAVSSSETGKDSITHELEESYLKPEESTTNEQSIKCTSPDSSSVIKTPTKSPDCKLQNGDIESHQEIESNEEVNNDNTIVAPDCTKMHSKHANGEMSAGHPSKPTPIKTRHSSDASRISSSTIDGSSLKPAENATSEDGSSSSEDDADFHAEENSSTEDGDEEPCDDETEDENEGEEAEEEEEEGNIDDGFCTNMIEEPGKDSGCTAVVALLHGRDLYVANAGDSRCVVCRKGKAVEMSLDHKPEDVEECTRIFQAGGKVTLDGRVNGGLNLSRAIGDHAYKMNKDLPPEKQMISALPDVRKLIISPDDEFMILACDGIWNFMSSDDVVEFVRKKINEGQQKMSQICEELFDICLAPNTIGDGTGCDNMTAVIVRFKPKIIELPTRISAESEAIPVGASKRRCSSPQQNDSEESNESTSKRFKTDDDHSNECDSESSVTGDSTDQNVAEDS